MLRRRRPSATLAEKFYPLLFDRQAVEDFDEGTGDNEVTLLFRSAREALKAGAREEAIAAWLDIADMTDLNSRTTLRAWRFLRLNGVQPPEELAHRVLGLVVEIPYHGGRGWDVVAAYADGTARFLSHGGGFILYEGGSEEVATNIGIFLDFMQKRADVIPAYSEEPLPALPQGHTRISALTPGGVRFGQGGDEVVAGDPMGGGEVVKGAKILGLQLIDLDSPDTLARVRARMPLVEGEG